MRGVGAGRAGGGGIQMSGGGRRRSEDEHQDVRMERYKSQSR